MKTIASLNINGVCNAAERGLEDWLLNDSFDLICLQGLKTTDEHCPDWLMQPKTYQSFVLTNPAGGVAILSRTLPNAVIYGLGKPELDDEARFIQVDFEQVSVASVLFPQPLSSDAIEHKLTVMELLLKHLDKIKRKRRQYIFCISSYIAHKTVDVGDWQQAQYEPGFLPEERAWMDQITGPVGYIDVYRQMHPQQQGMYSWWPLDETRHKGRRYDYQWASAKLAQRIFDAQIVQQPRLSPHCPVIVQYDIQLGAMDG